MFFLEVQHAAMLAVDGGSIQLFALHSNFRVFYALQLTCFVWNDNVINAQSLCVENMN